MEARGIIGNSGVVPKLTVGQHLRAEGTANDVHLDVASVLLRVLDFRLADDFGIACAVNAYETPCMPTGGLSMLRRSSNKSYMETERYVMTHVCRLQHIGTHLGADLCGQRTFETGSSLWVQVSGFVRFCHCFVQALKGRFRSNVEHCKRFVHNVYVPVVHIAALQKLNLPTIQPGVMQRTALVVGGSKGVGLAVSEHVDRLQSLLQ